MVNTKPQTYSGLWTHNFMVGSWSDRAYIINNILFIFIKFIKYFRILFFVAGVVFGKVGRYFCSI